LANIATFHAMSVRNALIDLRRKQAETHAGSLSNASPATPTCTFTDDRIKKAPETTHAGADPTSSNKSEFEFEFEFEPSNQAVQSGSSPKNPVVPEDADLYRAIISVSTLHTCSSPISSSSSKALPKEEALKKVWCISPLCVVNRH
jgi:hypothetical protein